MISNKNSLHNQEIGSIDEELSQSLSKNDSGSGLKNIEFSFKLKTGDKNEERANDEQELEFQESTPNLARREKMLIESKDIIQTNMSSLPNFSMNSLNDDQLLRNDSFRS